MALTINGQIDVATSNEYIYATISGFVVAAVSGEPVKISGESVSISGQGVLISGQLTTYSGIGVAVQSGYGVLTDISGQSVVTSISGQSVTVDLSGLSVITDISGQSVLISGQGVLVSGQLTTYSGIGVTVQSGYGVITNVSGQWTTYSGIGVTVQSGYGVLTSISGQSVDVDISGQPVYLWDRFPVKTGREYRADAWRPTISKPNTLDMLIYTSNRVVHLEYRALCGGEGLIVLVENPTVTSAGLIYGSINMNRASGNTSVTTIYTGGTHTSGVGTRLAVDYIANTQQSFTVSPGVLSEEFILNTSSVYLFSFLTVGLQVPIGLTLVYWEEI